MQKKENSVVFHQNESFADINFISHKNSLLWNRPVTLPENCSPLLRAVADRIQKNSQLFNSGPALQRESERLKNFLQMHRERNHVQTVVFSGAQANDGVSGIVLNLAKAFELGTNYRVLVIDAHVRSSGFSKFLGGKCFGAGVIDMLADKCPMRALLRKVAGSEIYFLTHGRKRRHATRYISSENLLPKIKIFESLFDFVLIDAPPLQIYPEGYVWARLSQGLILVLRSNQTRLLTIQKIKARASHLRIPILGTVLNRKRLRTPKFAFELH